MVLFIGGLLDGRRLLLPETPLRLFFPAPPSGGVDETYELRTLHGTIVGIGVYALSTLTEQDTLGLLTQRCLGAGWRRYEVLAHLIDGYPAPERQNDRSC